MILSQQLSTTATQNAAKPAFYYLEKETNYAELKTRVARLSYLYMKEIGHQARVAFITRNSPSVITAFFAISNTRSLIIPMDPDRSPEELTEWLKASKATHVAVTGDLVSKARDILNFARLHLPIVEIEKKQGGEYDTSFTPPSDQTPLDHDAILLLRTAGTTGKPKLVSLSHKQLHHAAISLKNASRFLPTDRMLTTLNWSHPFAFMHGMLMPILSGGTCVIDYGAEGREFLDFIGKARVTRLADRPAAILRLLLFSKQEKFFPKGIRAASIGMGFLSAELRKVLGMLKINISHVYGQTETAWTLAMEDPATSGAAAGKSVGHGLSGLKYKVLDLNGDEISGKGERSGMLAVMGPSVMSGYQDLEKETKQALRGTWIYTGDYVTLNGNGDGMGDPVEMTFLGRREDVIVTEDNRIITSEEIDRVLKGITGIQDGAGFVFRTNEKKRVLACAVVKAPGNALSEKQILSLCQSALSAEQAPHVCVFTDVIPRDAGGNVIRGRLATQFSEVTPPESSSTPAG